MNPASPWGGVMRDTGDTGLYSSGKVRDCPAKARLQ